MIKKLFRRLLAGACMLALCLAPASALEVSDAVGLLEEYYIDKLPAAAYQAATLDELFAAVGDPYTCHMNAEDYEAFNATVESETSVSGIGAVIEYTADGILITQLLEGGGAEAAGLAPGDLITAIDGAGCAPAGPAHRDLIIGEPGSFVTLSVRHPDGTVVEYRIKRRIVAIHNTTVSLSDGAGVIECSSFGSQTKRYFTDGLAQNRKQASHWIVDLRNNSGGLADAAVGTLGVFTGEGVKLYFRYADGKLLRAAYLAEAETDQPVIVLANRFSASASEIFAGGIRAERAGIVIGTRTFGKGTAQIVLDETRYPGLFDGDALKVTTYRFYCADGNTTDRIGVLPTLLIDDAHSGAAAALLKADPPESGEYLSFMLNGRLFYVDLAASRDNAALSELFAAFPPDLLINRAAGGETVLCLDAADAAGRCGVAYADRRFADSASSAYATPIDTLAVYGILRGDGTGCFHPDRVLTRAELAAMLAQALNVSSKASAGFSDVPDTAWYAGAVNAITSLGFLDGVGGGRFDPSGTLTQEQLIAAMGRLARFLNFHVDDYALALSDEELSAGTLSSFRPWARGGAAVLSGYAENMLYTELAAIDPNAPVTREQAAATLCNILKTLHILSY